MFRECYFDLALAKALTPAATHWQTGQRPRLSAHTEERSASARYDKAAAWLFERGAGR